MDPFVVFPYYVIEGILWNLGPKDLKTVSLVSKLWNRTVASSLTCMQRMRIVYNNSTYNNDIESLLKSNRNYHEVIIQFERTRRCPSSPEIEKNIRLIIKKFSHSIVLLETTHDIQRCPELPKLKLLTLKEPRSRISTTLYSNGIITQFKRVRQLLILRFLDKRSIQLVKNAMKSMTQLTFLFVYQNLFDQSRQQDFEFTLDTLYILEYISIDLDKMDQVFDVYRAYRLSLQYFYIVRWMRFEHVSEILSSFPMLHTLQVVGVDIEQIRFNLEDSLPTNETIHTLYLLGNNSLLLYITCFKNLKELQIGVLDMLALDAIPRSESLKLVRYGINRFPAISDSLRASKNIKFVYCPIIHTCMRGFARING